MEPAQVNDKIPSDAELEAALHQLRPHRSGGHTHLYVEHFIQWRREAYPGDNLKNPTRMERYMCLLDIVHNMWRTGEITQKLGWTLLILIPKGASNTWSIGMPKTLWKVVEALLDTRLRASLQLNDILHGLRGGRGTGTAIIELKLYQDIVRI